jgi:ABC-type dipeptide/oligopeptide/nickel transport system permease component
MWPIDFGITFITLILIVSPSVLCILYTILQADEKIIDKITKISILCLYGFGLFMCIIMLYYTAFTEPGIIPSVYQNSGILDTESLVPNIQREYYCEYMHKVDLNHALAHIGMLEDVDKFYSPMKYHYLPLTLDQTRYGN